MKYAKNFTDIAKEQIEIILNCKISILTNNKSSWIKSHTDNFGVLVDAYNFAQIADLIGIYVLDTLGRMIDPKQVG